MKEPMYTGEIMRSSGELVEMDAPVSFERIGVLINAEHRVQMININNAGYKCILFVHADGAIMHLPENTNASVLLAQMAEGRRVVPLFGDVFIGRKARA